MTMYVTEEELYGEQYTVWVGGTEINDVHLSKAQAKHLKSVYEDNGYDDVQIQRVEAFA
jgi:hypothetical protein